MKALTKVKQAVQRRGDPTKWLQSVPANTVLPDAIPFQDPVDEIMEELPPRHMRSTFYMVVGTFLATILTAQLVNVDIVVVGTGRLMTETPPLMLQPMDRAIIRDVNVRPGDLVTKGQILATLDPTFARADLASLSSQQSSILSQIRRLDAELNGRPFEPVGTATPDDLLQANLYRQRQAQYASQLKMYDEEIERRRANIRTTEDQIASLKEQLKVAKDVEAMRGTMAEKQIGSRLNHLEAQANRMRMEQEYTQAGNRITELTHELQSKDAERQGFTDQWRNQILDDLINARNEANKLGEGISKAALLNELVVVSAPEDGVILDVAKRSVGSVLREAEPLITIVKANAKLVAEVMINSADVGYAKPGDDVVVKVDSFPYTRHGMLKGRLVTIGEESFSNGSEMTVRPADRGPSGAFHRALIDLETTELENMPEGSRIIPGMTVAGEIKVGTRSVLSYFMTPITRGLQESIREP
ncbi:MAG: HlyD family type I secretion periplasmic adaptor subunit [Alphaproteobacteria bacterium]|nr:HlyD family type I secretion periplasmic adaptor subunit [Alphaproteobacteria bacterium]